MDADGTGVKRLSNYEVANLALAWSPDGDQIAFVGLDNSYNFYLDVMNADGSHLTPVISPETLDYFVFSPDGKWIAYSKRKKGNDDIYAVNTAGTTQINLTNNASANDSHPTFSPDGKKMAFESTSYDHTGKLVSEIYVMDLD
jgi:TolB protein